MRRLPWKNLDTRFIGKRVNGRRYFPNCLMPEINGIEHDRFWQFFGFGLHHQNGIFCTGNNQIQLGIFKFSSTRIQEKLAVFITHADSTHGGVNRKPRQGQSGRGPNHGWDVGFDMACIRNNGCDDLHFLGKTFGKKRTQRPVNQAGDKNFLLGRTPLSFEKTAGNTACGISALLIING